MAREFQNPEEIRAILMTGNFEQLKGNLENEFFGAKSEPWELDSERGKLELAKDISSLANWRGGIIVIGATTAQAVTYQRNEIQEIHPLPVTLAPTDRYAHVISEWIFPVPEGIEFRWHASTADPERGLIGVYVPNQSEQLGPFWSLIILANRGKESMRL